jgi:glyoxylase-like metal-dependent hydrolase (beta-lactamase superfamily II)
MTWTRRDFVTASTLAVVGSAFRGTPVLGQGPQQAPPPATPVFQAVRRNVSTFTARGGTIGTLITPDALVVVDSQFADTAPLLLDGLKSRSTRKIDLLINSHHHGDHTGGNAVLRPAAAKVVSHAHCKALLEKAAAAPNANPALKAGLPDTTFDKEWKQDVGSEIVSAKYYGQGHTGGDVVIFFERANIVHMGDLMSHVRNPRADRPAGASVRNWPVVLEAVVKDHGNDTIYVFGHSKVGLPVTGSRQDLMALRDYFTAAIDFVQKSLAAGKSQDEIVKAAAIPGFESWEGTPVALDALYAEMTSKS